MVVIIIGSNNIGYPCRFGYDNINSYSKGAG
jgi:hypothetical protein